MNAEQVAGGGGVYVQACVSTGVPPVQPDGDEVATVRACWPVEGQVLGVHALYVNEEQVAGGGGVYVQACVRTGVPPVQPDGDEDATVRACWPVEGQVLGVHALYVNEEQVAGGGGVYVQACVSTGVPPVQPDGDEVATVRACWPVEGQVLGVHALYVNEEQVAGVATASAFATASTSAEVRPIVMFAAVIWAAVRPSFVLVASGPWQLAHFAA